MNEILTAIDRADLRAILRRLDVVAEHADLEILPTVTRMAYEVSLALRSNRADVISPEFRRLIWGAE